MIGAKVEGVDFVVANTDAEAVHPEPHPGGGCTDNTITLKTDVILTGVMKRLINSNVTLQSDPGQTYTISGKNLYRPLFVKSGTVTIRNLKLNLLISSWAPM